MLPDGDQERTCESWTSIPKHKIYVLYRDMRTYGFSEDYFRKARERGVVFVQYELQDKPDVQADGDRIMVTFTDPILDTEADGPGRLPVL